MADMVAYACYLPQRGRIGRDNLFPLSLLPPVFLHLDTVAGRGPVHPYSLLLKLVRQIACHI